MEKLRHSFGIILLVMTALCGCSSRSQAASSERAIIVGGGGVDSAYSDRGVVYPGGNGYQGISFFFDPESGNCVPLCTKVNCSHKGLDGLNNPNPDCDAYYGYVDCDAVIGDRLYYVQTDVGKRSFREKLFCRADISGMNRKVLHRVENAEICNFSRYENGYLIFAYYNVYDEDGERMDTRDPGVYLLNLETEELEHLDMPAAYEGYIGMATIDNGSLYYFYSYNAKSMNDYSYEEIADDEIREDFYKGQRLELWRYDLASKEKECLRSMSGDQVGGMCLLDYGYLFMQRLDGNAHLEELCSGKVYEMPAGTIAGKIACLFDCGVIFQGDGEASVWSLDTGEYQTLCGYRGSVFVNAVTERWVYADRFDEDSCEGEFYMSRDRFLSGEWEWKPVPSRETQEKETQEAQEPVFDDYVIWAVPKDNGVEPSEETMKEINRKLAADGYSYGLKILAADTGNYLEQVREGGADIVSLGISYNPMEKRSQTALEEGLLLPLDDRLAGSALYDAFPSLMWEEVRYRGELCLIPSEGSANRYFSLMVNTDLFPEGLPDFDGDIFKLGEYLSKEAPLYYDAGLTIAQTLGYAYDRGLLFAHDGRVMNPLEEERLVEWFRTVNRWYQEGKILRNPQSVGRCGIALAYQIPGRFGQEWQECYSWKGYSIHRTEITTGILASSDRKDAAFSLLELFHTDHSYGNLLIYGVEAPTDNNMGFRTNKQVFGLATGLKQTDENETCYSTAAEWKQYFEEHIEPSPSLYIEHPRECALLVDLENKYFGTGSAKVLSSTGEFMTVRDIIACDDFETVLREYREELKEPMEIVLEKLAAQ